MMNNAGYNNEAIPPLKGGRGDVETDNGLSSYSRCSSGSSHETVDAPIFAQEASAKPLSLLLNTNLITNS